MDIVYATKLKWGSNERPCQFVKRFEVIGKFVVSEKQGGAVSEAGLGPATELEVELSPRAEFRAQSVHSHMPRQKGEKEQAMAAVSRIYHYQGSLHYMLTQHTQITMCIPCVMKGTL